MHPPRPAPLRPRAPVLAFPAVLALFLACGVAWLLTARLTAGVGSAQAAVVGAGDPGAPSIPQVSDSVAELVVRGVERRIEARERWGADLPEEGLALASQAREDLEQALGQSRSEADSARVHPELAEAWNLEGLILWTLTRYDEAVARYEAARVLWVALDDVGGLGRVHNNRGAAYYQWGYYDLALEAFLESLQFREALADTVGMARVLVNVGLVRMDWSQLDEADEVLTRAVDLADATGDPELRSYALQAIASLHLARGDLASAEAAYVLSGDLVPMRPYSQVPMGLARVRSARGEHAEAVRLLAVAAEEARVAGQRRLEVRAHLHLGEAYLAWGELDRALGSLEEALVLAEAQDIRPLEVSILETLARVHEAQGNPVAALAALRRYHALRDALYSQGTGQRLAATEARLEADRQARENLQLRILRAEQDERLARQRQVGLLAGALVLALGSLLLALSHFNRRGREREVALATANHELETTNLELTRALRENRALQGLIPICSHCKKVRDDQGYWEAVETYISQRSEALFSHSICADCGPRMYGEDWVDVRPPEPRAGSRPDEAPEPLSTS